MSVLPLLTVIFAVESTVAPETVPESVPVPFSEITSAESPPENVSPPESVPLETVAVVPEIFSVPPVCVSVPIVVVPAVMFVVPPESVSVEMLFVPVPEMISVPALSPEFSVNVPPVTAPAISTVIAVPEPAEESAMTKDAPSSNVRSPESVSVVVLEPQPPTFIVEPLLRLSACVIASVPAVGDQKCVVPVTLTFASSEPNL